MARGRKPGQFGSVNLAPSGRHRARYVGPDDQRYSRTFSEYDAAAAWLAQAQADIAYGKWSPPTRRRGAPAEPSMGDRERLTVAEWSARWLEAGSSRWSARTASDYESRLRLHFLPDLGQRRLGEVSRTDIDAWFSRLKRRRGPGVSRTAYMTTRALFASAVEEGLLAESPVRVKGGDRHEPVRRAKIDGDGHILTPAQVRAQAQAMPERLAALVWLGARCGLRLGEILGLRRCDLDLDRRTVSVRRQAVTCKGGMKETARLKTQASRRVVALPASLVPILESHLKTHARAGKRGLVFPRPGGRGKKSHEHPNSMRRVVSQAAVEAGVPEDLTPHDLRHTCLTEVARAGATLAEIMAVAGHSDPQVAMTYQHATRDRLSALADAVDSLYSGLGSVA